MAQKGLLAGSSGMKKRQAGLIAAQEDPGDSALDDALTKRRLKLAQTKLNLTPPPQPAIK